MANTDDLRYQRTERAIRAAFMELVAESSVASVTASGLCRRAEISRNAFYLHHASVSALYGALVTELVDGIRSESLASAERRARTGDDNFEAAVIAALALHEDVLRSLLPSDDGSLAMCLAEGIEAAYVEAALRFGERGGTDEHRLRCAFSAWALVGFARRWVTSCERPLTEGVAQFRELHASASESAAAYLLGGCGHRR